MAGRSFSSVTDVAIVPIEPDELRSEADVFSSVSTAVTDTDTVAIFTVDATDCTAGAVVLRAMVLFPDGVAVEADTLAPPAVVVADALRLLFEVLRRKVSINIRRQRVSI